MSTVCNFKTKIVDKISKKSLIFKQVKKNIKQKILSIVISLVKKRQKTFESYKYYSS